MSIQNNNSSEDAPIFEIKKWNAIALWSWGIVFI